MKNFCTSCGHGTPFVNLRAPSACAKCGRSFAALSGPTIKVDTSNAEERPTYSKNVNNILANLPPITEDEIIKSSEGSINLSDILSSKESVSEEIVEQPVKKKRGRKPKAKTAKPRKEKNEKEILANFFDVSDSDLARQQ